MLVENIEVIDRDYVDNFSIKDLAISNIMPKYFPEEVSNLTVGLTGMVTEYISIITEDTFNMASTMVLETFPTRAKMSSSIYSNAAIFQLSNVFVNAATCQFIILLDTKDIEKILREQRKSDMTSSSDYQSFYIDKDTTFYIEDIPFVLDYDIEIRARKRNNKMIYSAQYVTNEISDLQGRYGTINSLSNINDPYIKTVTSKNGYISLVLNLRQYTRNVIEENIIDNASLNYTSIEIPYNNKLAGFDVFYRKSGEDDWTYLDKKVIYSLPSKDPFCYYKRKSENSVEISFTTKDSYWQPSFNSEIKVVTYSSLGSDGNFDKYEGENISIIKNNERYDYPSSWVITAAPMTESHGGQDALDDEALQALTVEGFSTANALTTEYDLYTYFNNYKYRYGNEILFIKKRDDAIERLFTAFLFIKDNGYYYPTNTLTMDTNLRDFDVVDEEGIQGGLYMMEPGTLLSYKKTFNDNGELVDVGIRYDQEGNIINYGTKFIDFVKDESYYETGDFSYDAYINAIQTHEEYHGLTYDEYVHKKHMEEIEDDPTSYTKAGHYNLFNMDIRDVINLKNKYGFLFTSPFHMTINKYNGYISYYSLFTSQDSIMDFTKQSDLSYIHFITYTLHLKRNVENRKRYHLMLKVLPSQENDFDDYVYMDNYLGYYINAYNNITKSYVYTRFYYRDNGNGVWTLYSNLNEDKSIDQLSQYQLTKLRNFANVDLVNNCVIIPKDMYSTTEDIVLNFTETIDNIASYVDNHDIFNAVTHRHFTVCNTNELSYDYRENYFYNYDNDNFEATLSRFNKDIIRPKHINANGIQYITDEDGTHMIIKGNRLRIMAKFQSSNTENYSDIGYIELIPTEVNENNKQITFETEFYTDDYITEGDIFRSVHHCPYCGTEIKHSNIIKDGRTDWINPSDAYIEHGQDHSYFSMKRWQKYPYCCTNHDTEKYFDDGIINLSSDTNIWIPNDNGNISIDILYFDPYVVDATNEYYEAGLDDSLRGYLITDTYETITNPLNFITRMNMFRSSISFKDWTQPSIDDVSGSSIVVPLDCYIKDINLVKYSLLKYINTEEIDLSTDIDSVDDSGKINNFMKSFMGYYGYLRDAKYTLRNATNINIEFYNTYGKSTNFTIGDDTQEILSTNNISIKFKVWLTNGTDHVFATTELKQFIKDYIESINDDGTNSLYISNLIRSIENNFAYVHHLKFKGILNYDTDYQTITNTQIILNNLSNNERRMFVPDLLTINLNNIYIDCVDV